MGLLCRICGSYQNIWPLLFFRNSWHELLVCVLQAPLRAGWGRTEGGGRGKKMPVDSNLETLHIFKRHLFGEKVLIMYDMYTKNKNERSCRMADHISQTAVSSSVLRLTRHRLCWSLIITHLQRCFEARKLSSISCSHKGWIRLRVGQGCILKS